MAEDVKAWTEKHGELTCLMPADPTPYQRATLDAMTAKDPEAHKEAWKRLNAIRADANPKPFNFKKTIAEFVQYDNIMEEIRLRRSLTAKPLTPFQSAIVRALQAGSILSEGERSDSAIKTFTLVTIGAGDPSRRNHDVSVRKEAMAALIAHGLIERGAKGSHSNAD